MVRSFPPNPWTQQFYMLCVVIEEWHGCVRRQKELVYISRETFRALGIAEATTFDFIRYLQKNGLAEPLDHSHAMRNFLTPTKSGLLDIRKYLSELNVRFGKSGHDFSMQNLVNFSELVEHVEGVYHEKFGELSA